MTAHAPNSIVLRSVSYAAAARLVATAVDHVQAKGWRVCVAVCDSAESAVAMGRLDGVAATAVDFAGDKVIIGVSGAAGNEGAQCAMAALAALKSERPS